MRALLRTIALVVTVAGCGNSDPGVGVCSLTGGPATSPCAPASVSLSSDACRCGVHYFWDGTSCTSTAACRCFSGCDQLYETEAACVRDHASCLGLDASEADAGP